MIWDEDEGGCIDGRRLGRDEEGEIENAERDDCTEEDGCEGHRRLIKKDAEYEVSHISKNCMVDDECRRRLEDDESSDENEREEEHAGDAQYHGDGRNLGGCEESGEEDANEREEEHNGDLEYDDGAKRLLRAAIQN